MSEIESKKRSSAAQGGSHEKKQKHFDVSKAQAILDRTPLRALLKGKMSRVLTLFHNQTAQEALVELAKHKILSAPIVMAPSIEEPNQPSEYVGLISSHVLLHDFLLSIPKEKFGKLSTAELRKLVEEFDDRKLITFHESKDMGVVFNFELTHSTSELVNTFLEKKVHRVAVFNGKGEVNGVISQSDVLKVLSRHISELGDLRKATVKELGFIRPVDSVLASQTTLDALKSLDIKERSGVAVVDDDGRIVANLSESDLRGITTADWHLLQQSVIDFLQNERIAEIRVSIKAMWPKVKDYSLKESATLESVLQLFLTHQIHRVYIVDADHKPIGVVSPSDIVNLFA